MNATEPYIPLAGVFTVFIAIDEATLPLVRGRILSGYQTEAIPFCGLAELLLKIDGLCDTLDFPQAVFDHRRFYPAEDDALWEALPEMKRTHQPNICQTPQAIAAKFGPGPVFGVHILYRQHASWQGQLWSGRDRQGAVTAFRSALELLHLLNDALTSQATLIK